jgi:hypothetical protein
VRTSEAEAFVERTVRTWLGLSPSTDVPKLPGRLAQMLLRVPQYETRSAIVGGGAPAGNGVLRRACRALGFIPRNDFATLSVRTARAELHRSEAVVPTPLLWLWLVI